MSLTTVIIFTFIMIRGLWRPPHESILIWFLTLLILPSSTSRRSLPAPRADASVLSDFPQIDSLNQGSIWIWDLKSQASHNASGLFSLFFSREALWKRQPQTYEAMPPLLSSETCCFLRAPPLRRGCSVSSVRMRVFFCSFIKLISKPVSVLV